MDSPDQLDLFGGLGSPEVDLHAVDIDEVDERELEVDEVDERELDVDELDPREVEADVAKVAKIDVAKADTAVKVDKVNAVNADQTDYNEYVGGFDNDNNNDDVQVVTFDDRKYVIDNDIISGLRMAHIEWVAYKKFGEQSVSNIFKKAIEILKMRFPNQDVPQPIINLFTAESSVSESVTIKDFEGKEETLLYDYLHENNNLRTMGAIVFATDAHKAANDCTASLFHVMRRHFEYVMLKFIEMRNAWITRNGLPDDLNDIDQLQQHWKQILQDANVTNVTSVPLLFLNITNAVKHRSVLKPLTDVSSRLELDITDSTLAPLMTKLIRGIDNFYYPGMCIYEPTLRYTQLMQFPIMEFASVLRVIWPGYDLPDYKSIEIQRAKFREAHIKWTDKLQAELTQFVYNVPKLPAKLDGVARCVWYVDEIFNKFFAFKKFFKREEERGVRRVAVCQQSHEIYKNFGLV